MISCTVDVNLDPNEHMHQIIVRILIGLYMHGENTWDQDWTVGDIFELEWATDSVAADAERDAVFEALMVDCRRVHEMIKNKNNCRISQAHTAVNIDSDSRKLVLDDENAAADG